LVARSHDVILSATLPLFKKLNNDFATEWLRRWIIGAPGLAMD
jgi:hypothetical protein